MDSSPPSHPYREEAEDEARQKRLLAARSATKRRWLAVAWTLLCSGLGGAAAGGASWCHDQGKFLGHEALVGLTIGLVVSLLGGVFTILEAE